MLQFAPDEESGIILAPVEIRAGTAHYANSGGSSSNVTLNGGTLSVSGRCGSVTSIAGGGSIHSIAFQPVILTTGALNLNNVTQVKLKVRGTVGGIGHDQLSVIGSVKLNGAALVLEEMENFNVAPGQNLTILANDGADGIPDTFGGLPQGAFIPASEAAGGGWTISYTGGSNNNDIVLTRVPNQPVPPALTTVAFSKGTGSGGNDQITLGGTATPGAVLKLEASADISNAAEWIVLQNVTANASGAVNVVISQTPGFARRFFRLRP